MLIFNLCLANDEEGEGGATGGDEGVTVIDVVDAHRLKEIELDKKSWTAYIKGKWSLLKKDEYLTLSFL